MRKIAKYIFLVTLLISGISLLSGTTGRVDAFMYEVESMETAQDTSTSVLYPVKKTQITTYEDLDNKSPIDLRDPSNVKTEIEYDYNNNVYLFRTRIGDVETVTPFVLTPDEYSEYTLKRSLANYYKQKNQEMFERGTTTDDYPLKEIKISTNPMDKIFGPGGVKIRPQGYIEVSAGIKHSKTDNPTLSERNRSRTMFDFDEKIQLSMNATIGDRMNFDLNYDTEATFDFDSKKIKLAYEGKEDEIIRYLEGGNVSFSTTNSLISGASSLFGIRADLQFGKLRVNTVLSQQLSESQKVSSKGGVQTTSYELKADEYDENRHFFLANYFRDNYDNALSRLPVVRSSVTITKVEAWITNKRGNYDNARNIVAFADLGENEKIKNPTWNVTNVTTPDNKSNNLYTTVTTTYSDIRDISKVNSTLSGAGLETGLDYEKVESARLLSSSEYSFHPQLGYISLNFTLQSDEVLAVAYEYTIGADRFQVGEFSSNSINQTVDDTPSEEIPNAIETANASLIVKLLKPVSLSPRSYTWDLMMKNVYYLGSTQIQSDRFRLNIYYQSDTLGTYINYLPEGNIQNELLLRVMNLDRLNSNQRANPDGIFDFLENYTIKASTGRVYFPVVEPFGEHLRKQIGNDLIADKYVYQELYDSTLTVARQIAEKNKFKISGSYKGNSNNDLNLNGNIAYGSAVVSAGGQVLTEGVHYIIDYTSGNVTLIDQSIIDAGTEIIVSVENQNFYNMQRKTMFGTNLTYDFSKNFNIGATFMHLYEKPLTTKTEIGYESVKNTLWGLNTSFRTESQWLTDVIDKLPFVNATAPSQISLDAEFAHMIPGHYENKYTGGYSYLDDFESSRSKIEIRSPYGWFLSSTPSSFEEASLSDDVTYGKNRAHMAWFMIDNMFTRKNSSIRPSHINNDDLSDHRVRQIEITELYPNRQSAYNETATLSTLNISYYPKQRGPYNLDWEKMNSDGTLMHPEERWGGIMRKMDLKDFESNNIEYIEFWLMDPFVYDENHKGGALYFNLGEISEDILKDGRKFFENGLPVDGDGNAIDYTRWGKVPKRQSTVYAFDTDQGNNARLMQDVGLNGLSTAEEFEFGDYKTYVEQVRNKVSAETQLRMENDPFSPLRDPAGDNYHHYRGSDYDREEVGILDRYKYYNGTEGNSTNSGDESYSTAARSVPDVEDIDQDNTLNETESYYEYKVELRPNKMQVGESYITATQTANVRLANGQNSEITWYQFKIPIKEHDNKVGTISDFKSIRYMRMYLTDFEEDIFLRFGSLELVRGEWRTYTQQLDTDITQDEGTLTMSSVNIEENSKKEPVNYVLPPGINRILDPSQPQLRQENEQALSLTVAGLSSKASRAIYKNTNYDLRQYKRLQMFTHAESLIDKEELQNGELTVFLRLGSDYKNNYYEYEIPLKITPAGTYNTNVNSDQLAVWPEENMFDFPLDLLRNIKLNRNAEKRKSGSTVSYTTVYSEYDPDKLNNKVSVVGNPSLSDISVIMVGVRNNSNTSKSGEIWINELRLTDFDEEGGWAAKGNLNIALSDLGNINISGHKETIGFGSIEQSLTERRMDDYQNYSIATNLNLGRFLPEQIKANIPFYYTYSNEKTTPKYDPLDQDITLKEAMSLMDTKAEKDSIKSLAQDRTVSKNLSFSGVRFNIRSKTPMPYDPANFTFGYAYRIVEDHSPTLVYDKALEYRLSLGYSYSPLTKTWKPFGNTKSKAPMSKYAKAFGINYLPNNISFNSHITRDYIETLTRDLESYSLGGDNSNSQFLTYSGTFYWERDFSLTWDFMKNLKASIQTGTKAEIEEPYLQVNKKLNPDDYYEWRREVRNSLKSLGDPLSYRQSANLTYTLPFSDIPFLDWINSSANYDSNYSWDRGATIEPYEDEEVYEVGNTIQNSVTYTLNNRINLVNLYNKSPFLKKVNQKFNTSRSSAQRNQRNRNTTRQRRFEQEIALKPDTTTQVRHGLNTKNIKVTARNENGRAYEVKFKKVDNNNILITNLDTTTIKINVVPGKSPEEMWWYKTAEYGARGLMSVRNISVNYSRRNETYIYGFRPNIGDVFGQNSSDYGLVPGLGFAFGFEGGESYVDKAIERDWMVKSSAESNINPAIFNNIEKIDIKAQLEPVRGLKIDLSGLREKNDRTQYDYTYGVRTYGGSFSMSVISLSSAFESANAKNGYYSASFQKFLENRNIIADRIEKQYENTSYPNSGFIAKAGMGNFNYNPESNGGVDRNSADVLIPSFLSAYTGRKASSISLSPFPALSSLVPNWTVTYDGLTTLPWFKDKFKSLKLTHGYTSQYRIGSYQSHTGWVDAGDGLGFIESLSGTPIPSSPYDITSVTIVEQFNPLFGAEGTLNSNMTLRAKYNTNRTLTLNISSYQIVEALQNELVLGMGYRINEFNRIIGLTARNAKGFNNDLNINANISHKVTKALLRKIEELYTQATSGTTTLTFNLSADYAMSRALTLRAYFDRVVNTPIVSASAYPTANTNFGVAIRFTLTQ